MLRCLISLFLYKMDNENLPFYKRKLGCLPSVLVGIAIFIILMFIGSLFTEDNTSNNPSAFDTDTTNTTDTETPNTEIPNTVETRKEYQLLTTFTGNSDRNTESFSVTSDKVKLIGFSTTAKGWVFVDLRPEDGSSLYTSGLQVSSDNKERTSETIYRNLKTGSYYLDISGYGSWKVEIYQEIETPITE